MLEVLSGIIRFLQLMSKKTNLSRYESNYIPEELPQNYPKTLHEMTTFENKNRGNCGRKSIDSSNVTNMFYER